jgi:predicted N-acyltransferase
MSMRTEPVAIRVVSAMAEIDRTAWDACANPGWTCARANGALDSNSERAAFNPFVSWDFLRALEESGSVSARTGWAPRHLLLEGPDGPAGFVPCYLKSHSHGEYVFDWGWADAYERAGGRYYPKLQVSVPFTPVTGARLLAGAGPSATERKRLLAAGLIELCRRLGASSTHLTFLPEADCSMLGEMGFLTRTDQQFHWTDEGYGDFDGFLGALASRKRKALRRERREAVSNGISIEWITGADLTEAHWDSFFSFYMDTGSRKWGRPYLNRRFFSLIGERMADRVLLVMAKRAGRYVAGALNFLGSDTLYGRYWGAVEEHPFLHFEVCYYQAIDFALAHRLRRVEAGAQGSHKLARGYLPQLTYSAHHITDPGFRRAIEAYLVQERREVAYQNEALAEHAPFRHIEAVDRGIGDCEVPRGASGGEE